MSVQVETKPTLREPEPKICNRIYTVSFVESVTFGATELSSASVPGKCEAILPARLLPDGSPALLTDGQVATGLLLRKRSRAINALGGRLMEQTYVPIANVKSIQYAE